MKPNFASLNEPVELRLATGLAKIGLALRQRAWQEATPQGLTPTQGQILALLRLHPGATLAQVAHGLGVKPATASEAVKTLVVKELVEKSRRPEDGRSLSLSLTRKGEDIAREAAQWPDFLAQALDTLTDEEKRIFLRAVIRLIRALQDRGEISVSRMCLTCRFFRAGVYDDPRQPHHCAYVDAPFGDLDLRLECQEHEPAEASSISKNWQAFS